MPSAYRRGDDPLPLPASGERAGVRGRGAATDPRVALGPSPQPSPRQRGEGEAPSAAQAPAPRRVVILGIGNTILSDEGAGVHAAVALRDAYALPPGVEVIDGGTAGMELLDALASIDLLLVFDAVKARRAPGTVVCLTGREVPVFFRSKLSPHQVSICDVLASLEFAGEAPADLVLVGVEPESLELGLEMTATVAARIPEMVALAVEQLAGRGVALRSSVAAPPRRGANAVGADAVPAAALRQATRGDAFVAVGC